MNDDLFDWIPEDMLEITIDAPDQFLKIKETLTRIGVASSTGNILYPSANILHKRGRYYIVSFKELFCLDGKETNLTNNDIARRNTIAVLLQDWGLLTVVKDTEELFLCPVSQLKIIHFKDKKNWTIIPKYTIGNI